MDNDARTVRPGEQLNWERLVAWLREHLPDCGVPGLDVTREPDVAQFPGGIKATDKGYLELMDYLVNSIAKALAEGKK